MKLKDFDKIFRENYALLAGYAYNRIKNEKVSKDLASNALIKLWNKKPSISSPEAIKDYLIECTRKSANRYNTKDRIGEALIQYNINEPTSHEISLIQSRYIDLICKSLNLLPPRVREIVELTMAGLNTTEIATRLGCRESTVIKMKSRGQENLKKHVSSYYIYPTYNTQKQTESREQIIKIQNEVNEEFIKYYTKHPHKLYNISPRQYEIFVAELLKDMGYEVWLNNHTKDGGRDIIALLKTLANDSIVTLVECKKYSLDNPVPIEVVKSFLHTIRDQDKANAGWIVTTSTFSRDAKKYQRNYKWQLSLKDNKDLATLCSNYGKWKRTSEGSGLWLPDNPLG